MEKNKGESPRLLWNSQRVQIPNVERKCDSTSVNFVNSFFFFFFWKALEKTHLFTDLSQVWPKTLTLKLDNLIYFLILLWYFFLAFAKHDFSIFIKKRHLEF